MEIKITGTQKEVTDFMLAFAKSAEQNDNTNTITHTKYNSMTDKQSTIELPLINDVNDIEKQFKSIKKPIYSPTAEAERSQK